MDMSPHRVVSSLPTGTGLTRFLIAKSLGVADGYEAAAGMRDTPHILPLLRAEAEWHVKAGVDPMTTGDATAAAPLAQYGIVDEVLQLLRGVAVYDQLTARMRRVPPHVSVPREVTGATAAWIQEAAPMPIVNDAFATVQVDLHKLGCAVVLSKELLRVNRTNEALIRQAVMGGVAAATDTQLLDPTITAIPFQRPASITNGATAVTSTGGTAAQIVADLTSLIQAITTPMRSATWILPSKTAATIAARLAGVGTTTTLPTSLLSLPAIVSANAPARQITLVDLEGIVYTDAGLTVDVATHGSVEMSTVGTSPPTAGTVMVNLWQASLIAVKCLRWLSWMRAVPGSVSYMSTTY